MVLKFNRFGPGYKPAKPHDHKLTSLSIPLRIVEKLSPLFYRLALPKGDQIHSVVCVIHLRRYRGSGGDVQPLSVTVGDVEEFE